MKREQIPKLLNKLLSNAFPKETSDDHYEISESDLIKAMEQRLNAYCSFCHQLQHVLETTPSDLDIPVERLILANKVNDSKNVMCGPTETSNFMDSILSRLDKENLKSEPQPHDLDKINRISAALKHMVDKEEILSTFADRLISEFNEHFYSPEAVLQFHHIGLEGERLSAAYADDNRAASREISSINKRSEIYKRLAELAKLDINDYGSMPDSASFKNPIIRDELNNLPGFEDEFANKISETIDLTRNLEKISSFASRGREEFGSFPHKKVQRVLLGRTTAWFDNNKQREKINKIQIDLLEGMKKSQLDPSTKRKALVHCQKMFVLVDNHLKSKSRDKTPELTS